MWKKVFCMMTVLLTVVAFSSCSDKDDGGVTPDPGGSGSGGSATSTLRMLSSGLGSWMSGYITDDALFLYDEDEITKTKAAVTSGMATLYFSKTDGSQRATLLVSLTDHRPLQLVMGDGVLNFSWLSDEVLELVFTNGSNVKLADQINYDKKALDTAFEKLSKKNQLHSALFYFVKTVNVEKLASYPTVQAAAAYFREVFDMNFDGTTVTPEEAGLNVGEDGVLDQVKEADKFEQTVVAPVFNTVTIWTGKASFKVGGSSCTLSGTVFCADDDFAKYGTVGIVCDSDPNKLYIGQAEYSGEAEIKEGNNFDVDFRGFKPKTTYYYRAYFKFNDSNHGSFILDSKQKFDSETAYDNVTKTFTTDENKLTVTVAMCIDISGSMGGTIDMVKNNARDFYSLFKTKCENADIKLLGLNARVIPYSDINVDYEKALYSSGSFDLTDEVQYGGYIDFVNGISLAYGGDTPESGLEALNEAFANTKWGVDDGYHRQIVILWTDAPYKVINEGICKDEEGKDMFVAAPYEQVKNLWDNMPSGRRMILFAPYGTTGSNSGSWGEMDEWKNVLHNESSYASLSDFDKSLDYIISELTGKETETTKSAGRVVRTGSTSFRPNK